MDQKYLKVKRVSANGDGQLVFGDTIKVRPFVSRYFEVRSGRFFVMCVVLLVMTTGSSQLASIL